MALNTRNLNMLRVALVLLAVVGIWLMKRDFVEPAEPQPIMPAECAGYFKLKKDSIRVYVDKDNPSLMRTLPRSKAAQATLDLLDKRHGCEDAKAALDLWTARQDN